MDDRDPALLQEDRLLLTYPGRVLIPRTGGSSLNLPAVLKDIYHAGATVRFEARHLPNLAELLAPGRLTLEFTGSTGRVVRLLSAVVKYQRRADGQALVRLRFETVHLEDVEEIQAVLATSRKDQHMLWQLWDDLRQEG
ncbi:MAG: hypothetical protein V2A77_00060 [Pseudomonadota bacterium]